MVFVRYGFEVRVTNGLPEDLGEVHDFKYGSNLSRFSVSTAKVGQVLLHKGHEYRVIRNEITFLDRNVRLYTFVCRKLNEES